MFVMYVIGEQNLLFLTFSVSKEFELTHVYITHIV